MKRILLLLFSFIMIFSFSQARGSRLKLMEDVPWYLEYSYNKYGEEDKIISAQCGQWSMKNRVKVIQEGMVISIEDPWHTGAKEKVEKISFLFDSNAEIIMTNIEELEYDGLKGGKTYFINRSDENYRKLINKIKSSNYMSILIEDIEGNCSRLVKVKNTDSYKVLTTFENSLK